MQYSRAEAIKEPLRIGVMVPTDFAYAREIVRGLLAAPDTDRTVDSRLFSAAHELLPGLAHWRPHGLVAYLDQANSPIQALRELNIPVVNVGNPTNEEPFPRVGVDDRAIGAMAAEYFLERGYRQLGYVHYPHFTFSKQRWQGFREAAEHAGCPCQDQVSRKFWDRYQDRLWSTFDHDVAEWLRKIPKPLGLLAANDGVAAHVVSLCQRLAIPVPDQVAVLGVDNDDIECLTSHPQLSSIQLPTRRIGEAAYEMLRKLLASQPPDVNPLLLPPIRVITRPSSETLALADPEVAMAVRFIHSHAEEAIGVKDLVRVVQISRRAMEMRFVQALGRSPLQEIRKTRVELAKRQLLDTNLKVVEVARRCGFVNMGNFITAFREHTGLTPAAYRQTYQIQEG